MPIYQTLEHDQIDLSLFYDADSIRVGESYARLLGFVQGDNPLDVFTCDSGTYSALRRAAARIAGIERDKTTTVRYVERMKEGRKTWKRLAKNATTKTNDVTREATVRSYSSAAIRRGIETLRDSRGVAVKRQATNTNDDKLVVALVRNEPVATVVEQ